MTSFDADAVIVGAGPAGAAVAIGLAEQGRRVLVVESRRFPRSKVCGEFISPAVGDLLESLVGNEGLDGARAVPITRMHLACDGLERRWALSARAWAMGRDDLDADMADLARRRGALVLQPATVRKVAYREDGISALLADGAELRSKVIVHADGTGRHDPAGPVARARGLVGIKCHARDVAPSGVVAMRALRGAYVGTISLGEGTGAARGTLAACVKNDLIRRWRGDHDAMLGALWPGFDPRCRIGPWLSCPIARSGAIEPGHPRSFRVGNAGGAVDPVGGEGIGLALWSGDRLAGMLERCDLDRIGDLGVAQAEFLRATKAKLRLRRFACRAAAEVLMRPSLVRAMWPALGMGGLTIEPWYRLSGKPGCLSRVRARGDSLPA